MPKENPLQRNKDPPGLRALAFSFAAPSSHRTTASKASFTLYREYSQHYLQTRHQVPTRAQPPWRHPALLLLTETQNPVPAMIFPLLTGIQNLIPAMLFPLLIQDSLPSILTESPGVRPGNGSFSCCYGSFVEAILIKMLSISLIRSSKLALILFQAAGFWFSRNTQRNPGKTQLVPG